MAIEIILALLFVKHFLVDFVLQTDEEISKKGDYLHWEGLKHSVSHGFLTYIIFLFFVHPSYAMLAGLLDTLIHYHIDYIKQRFGCKDIRQKKFWVHLGLDQLLHQLTYIALCLVFIN